MAHVPVSNVGFQLESLIYCYKVLGQLNQNQINNMLHVDTMLNTGVIPGFDLPAIRHLLTLQNNGQEGKLLIDGKMNIFYHRNFNLVIIYLSWDGTGWVIDADEYDGDPKFIPQFEEGSQVFSYNKAQCLHVELVTLDA